MPPSIACRSAYAAALACRARRVAWRGARCAGLVGRAARFAAHAIDRGCMRVQEVGAGLAGSHAPSGGGRSGDDHVRRIGVAHFTLISMVTGKSDNESVGQ
jgi:hypothetical protein